MKKILLMVSAVMLFSCISLAAQEADTAEVAAPDTISWYFNYDSAISAANAGSRDILIEFYTTW